MSLKAFHVAFISLCVMLCLGLAVAEWVRFGSSGDGWDLVWGVLAALAAASLVWYARAFLHKLKQVSNV